MRLAFLRGESVASGDERCRLCLRVDRHATMIFDGESASKRLPSRIRDCCAVKLVEDDELPKVICRECEGKVRATHEFRERCRRSERILLRLKGSGNGSAASDIQDRPGIPRLEESATSTTEEEKRVDVDAGTEDGAVDGAEDGPEEEEERGKTQRYLCDVCSKTFASKSGLRFHLKSHSGEKPHLCRHCGKGFAIPSYARRHERIHSCENRFACQFCSAMFASANGLRYHLRSHTGEANYRCRDCGKSFSRRKYLKEHAFTHTGERPYACKTCGSSYGNSGSLFAHEKRCGRKTPSARGRGRGVVVEEK